MAKLDNSDGLRDFNAEFVLGDPAGSALSVDTNDPNTTAPTDARICFTPTVTKAVGGQTNAFVFADNACVLEGWIFVRNIGSAGKWVKMFSSTVAAAYTAVAVVSSLAQLPIPDGFPFFLRVQANSGSAKVAAVVFH